MNSPAKQINPAALQAAARALCEQHVRGVANNDPNPATAERIQRAVDHAWRNFEPTAADVLSAYFSHPQVRAQQAQLDYLADQRRRLLELTKAYGVMFQRAVGAFGILAAKTFPSWQLAMDFAAKAEEQAVADGETVTAQLNKTLTMPPPQ